MRVVSKSRLVQFWEAPGRADAEGPLRALHTHVSSRSAAWQSWGDLKASFAGASIVGDCIVFNIGGNKFRLITRIRYATQKVFILKVMTHTEYDEDKWKDECGCFDAPPLKQGKLSKAPAAGQKPRGR